MQSTIKDQTLAKRPIILGYVLIKGEAMAWQDQQKLKEVPFLYLGNVEKLKQDTSRLPTDVYSRGQCRIQQISDVSFSIDLCPEKGKASSDNHMKAIKKVLKKSENICFTIKCSWQSIYSPYSKPRFQH